MVSSGEKDEKFLEARKYGPRRHGIGQNTEQNTEKKLTRFTNGYTTQQTSERARTTMALLAWLGRRQLPSARCPVRGVLISGEYDDDCQWYVPSTIVAVIVIILIIIPRARPRENEQNEGQKWQKIYIPIAAVVPGSRANTWRDELNDLVLAQTLLAVVVHTFI